MRYLITLLPLVIAAAALAPSVRVIDGDTLDLSGERIRLWASTPPKLAELPGRRPGVSVWR